MEMCRHITRIINAVSAYKSQRESYSRVIEFARGLGAGAPVPGHQAPPMGVEAPASTSRTGSRQKRRRCWSTSLQVYMWQTYYAGNIARFRWQHCYRPILCDQFVCVRRSLANPLPRFCITSYPTVEYHEPLVNRVGLLIRSPLNTLTIIIVPAFTLDCVCIQGASGT